MNNAICSPFSPFKAGKSEEDNKLISYLQMAFKRLASGNEGSNRRLNSPVCFEYGPTI